MSKTLKITLVLFIILSSICSFSLATDIDMNITSNDNVATENVTTNTNTSTRTNTLNNNTTNVINEDEDAIYEEELTATNSEYTTISSVNKSSVDDGLSLSNILNILLIVVGVVLILLAIAILIRLHV